MLDLKECAVIIGMTAAIFAQGVCAQAQTRERITDDVFRLHIIANSDSDEDQKLKLKVRDAVLEAGAEIFDGSTSAAQAAQLAEENMELLVSAAEKAVLDNGYAYDVCAEVGEVYFDERAYGSAVLPEGEYTALCVRIGKAQGKNWWCVMFPPLCLPAVTNTDEVLAQAGSDGVLTSSELDMIKDPESYQVRFYFADRLKELAEYLEKAAADHDVQGNGI